MAAGSGGHVELAQAFVTIIPTTKGIQGAVAKQFEPAVAEAAATGEKAGSSLAGGVRKGAEKAKESVRENFKEARTFALGALGLTGGFELFKDLITDGNAAAKTAGITAQAIKSTGGAAHVSVEDVNELAEKLSVYGGTSAETVKGASNLILTFTNIKNAAGEGNDVFDQTTKAALDMATAMHTDARTAALQLGKALNDPEKGLTKLQRSGVSFTKSQVAQIKALQDSGHTLEAQKIILGEVNREFGGAAGAAATPAAKMEAAYHNLTEEVGTRLLPVVNRFANFLGNTVIPDTQKLFNFLDEHSGTVKAIGLAVGAITVALAAYAVEQKIAAAVTTLSALAFGDLDAAMDANPIGLVVAAIAALVAGAIYAYTHFKTFHDIVNAAFTGIRTVITAVVGFLSPYLSAAFSVIGTIFHTYFTVYFTVVKAVFEAVKTAIVTVINFLHPFLSAAFTVIKVLFSTYFNVWKTIVVTVFNAIRATISTVWNAAVSIIHGGATTISTVIHAVSSAISGIGSAFSTAYNDVKRYIGDIVTFVQGMPGKISRFGGDMLSAGAHLIGQLFSGLKQVGGQIADVGTGIVNAVVDGLNDILPHHVEIPLGFGKHLGVDLFPHIPHLATGGTIGASPGGTPVIVGEAGRAETIVDTASLNAFARTTARIAGQFGGDSGGSLALRDRPAPQINVYPAEKMSEATIGRIAADRLSWEASMPS